MAVSRSPRHPTGMRIPANDTLAIAAHLTRTGWAIAADVLDASSVAALTAAVQATCPLTTDTRCDLAVIERAPAVADLLRNRLFVSVMRACIGANDLVVHRSAALRRPPEGPGIGWHSDFAGEGYGAEGSPDSLLNRGEWPNGAWFYLDGCYPERGGLAVMEGSHVPGWRPPTAWTFDLPGVVSIIAEPGDLILFAARTWHAAHPLTGIMRHSLGLNLRPRSVAIQTPKLPPPATTAFLAGLPDDLRPWFDGYAGWLPDPR